MFILLSERNIYITSLVMALSLVGCSANLSVNDDDMGEDTSGNPTTGGQGTDENLEIFSNGLSCSTVSMCSTYSVDLEFVEMPATLGGVVRDGLYKPVAGTDQHFGLAIYQDRYSLIWDNLSVSHGELSYDGNTMTQTRTTICSNDTFVDDPEFRDVLPYGLCC